MRKVSDAQIMTFLNEVRRYFENRPTHGEDAAYWSNMVNSAMTSAALARFEELSGHQKESDSDALPQEA